ncbi:glycoside hydrolase family 26 protein [Cellulomonas soli]|uniref:glycoside hydrolase family 26 protein n=1 Tax=Cellulomonas soli TaxID=931535 RepID=UPI003F843E1F
MSETTPTPGTTTTRWWHSAGAVTRARIGAAAVALSLTIVAGAVWLSPSNAQVPAQSHVSAEEQRLAEENEALRNSLDAREDELAAIERSQAKAAAERAAGAATGQAKAAAEKAAAEEAAAQKAAEEQAAAAARAQAKAAAEKAAATAKGQARAAQDRAEQAERQAAEAAARAQAAATQQNPPAADPAPVAAPTAPARAALLNPTSRLFGLYTTQSPFSWAEFDDTVAKAGATPDMAGYFQGWDTAFRADAVTRSWTKGLLPLLTWESRPMAAANDVVVDPAYSLPVINAGTYDDYLRTYAADVAALGLPVAIRLDHEMNAGWYPWNEQGSGGAAVNGNSRGDYVTMWRHVHDIFEAAGANQYVIWVWAPNIVNNLPAANQSLEYTQSLYPGDEYVDWVGLSGYYRPPYREDQTPTFDYTFGRTLEQLRTITDKPILLAEIGASETGGGDKPSWVTDLFDALARPENDDILGLAWFNLTVTTVSEGELVTNDWRITSRPDSLDAFVVGISDPAARF